MLDHWSRSNAATSWLAWLPLLAAVHGWIAVAPWSPLHLLGALGPAAAAVIVVGVTEGRTGLRRLGGRLLAWRGRPRAWAFVALVPPLLLLAAAPLASLAGGDPPLALRWSSFGRSAEFASLPLVVWWLVNLGFYGVGEEVGWRGFLSRGWSAGIPSSRRLGS